MYRIILFLLLIALAAAGAAWVADQTGDVVLSWGGVKIVTTLPVFALALAVTVVAAMLVWSLLRALWRMPEKIRRGRRERRHARGRHVDQRPVLCALRFGEFDLPQSAKAGESFRLDHTHRGSPIK